MSDWKHWLDEASEADEFERSILRSGLEGDPPETRRDQVWSSLMGALAVAPLVAATTSAEAASAKAAAVGVSKASAVCFAVGKGFVVGLAVYGAAAGVTEISNRLSTAHAPALTAPRAHLPMQASAGDAEPLATPTPTLVPAIDDAPSTPHATQRSSSSALAHPPLNDANDLPSVASFDHAEKPSEARVSQLEAETRSLRRARDELRLGRLADAFATLEAARRQFPTPELYQEHEALMIELLYRSGQASTAEQRAAAFLKRFPESPHAEQIRRFAAR